MKKHLVLFDFDGTLADTAPDLAAAANRQRSYRGLEALPYEELRPYSSQGARGLLYAALGLTPESEEYESARGQFLRDYSQAMLVRSQLFPEVASLLDRLSGQAFAWGIVTNKATALVQPMMHHLGLTESVVTVAGDTTPHIKPHPAPLLHAAKHAGFAPEMCIYVGDDERDIVAGKAAGMATVAAAYGYCTLDDPYQWQADAIVHSAAEIWPVILDWSEGRLKGVP